MASQGMPSPPGNGAPHHTPLAPGEWLPERAAKAVGTISPHGSRLKRGSSKYDKSNTTPTTAADPAAANAEEKKKEKVKFGNVIVLDCVSEVVVDRDSGKVLDMHLGVYDPSPSKHTSPLSAYEQQRVMEGRSEGKSYSRMGRMDEKKKLTLAKLGGYCKYGPGDEQYQHHHGEEGDADEEPPDRPRSRSLFVHAPPSNDSDDDGEEQNLEHMMDFPDLNSAAATNVAPSQEADTTPPPGTSSKASKRTSKKGNKKDCVVS